MKYFKDPYNTVFAFEADGSQDAFIPQGLVAITSTEADALRAPPSESWNDARDRALALLKTERAPIISVLDGLQGTAATKGLAALLSGENEAASAHSLMAQKIEALKQALRDAPALVDLSACADFAAMRVAGKVYYASLVKGAPADVVTAFREVV